MYPRSTVLFFFFKLWLSISKCCRSEVICVIYRYAVFIERRAGCKSDNESDTRMPKQAQKLEKDKPKSLLCDD